MNCRERTVTMNKTNYLIIQLHAVMLLVGYYFMHSVVGVVLGGSTRFISIVYDGIQLVLSLYVVFLCHRNIRIERGKSVLSFLLLLMFLYSLRIVYDMAAGPFVGRIPQSWFRNDFLMIVVSTFTAVWAVIVGRKWIDLDIITQLVFWLGLITILCIVYSMRINGLVNSYQDDRLDGGQGLGTLALCKIGAIEAIASLHLILNIKKHKASFLFALLGLVLGVWLMLASGSRGGVAGFVIALGVYFLFSSRRNVILSVVAIIIVTLIVVNIVPILLWVSDYFPIFGQRMLNAVLENDQSSRQELRKAAINLILENPLFGYSYRLNPIETGFLPHNGILDVFLALGIPVGFLFVFFIYIKGMVMSLKMMTNTVFFFPSVFAVFVLVSSMSSSSLANREFDFAITVLAIAYYYFYDTRTKSSTAFSYLNKKY